MPSVSKNTQGAAGTKVLRLHKFRSIIPLGKKTLWRGHTFKRKKQGNKKSGEVGVMGFFLGFRKYSLNNFN